MTRTADNSLSDRDASVLGPLAEHRILTVPQVAVLLGVGERTALRRLQALERERLIRLHRIFRGLPWAAAIQSPGLRRLGSPLKTPQLNLNEYRHDVGVGWLWLAARAGNLGEVRGIATDRRMQAQDARARGTGDRPQWGVGLGMLGSHGQPRFHYPDLMLELSGGHRVAVELELTAKSAGRMARIMSAYASDSGVDQVLYLVASRAIATRVRESAHRACIPERVHVQLLAPDGIAGAEIGRMRSRAPINAHTRARLPARAGMATAAAGSAER